MLTSHPSGGRRPRGARPDAASSAPGRSSYPLPGSRTGACSCCWRRSRLPGVGAVVRAPRGRGAGGPRARTQSGRSRRPPGVAADPDTSSVQLGVRFRSSEAGWVSAIRFYKSAANGVSTPAPCGRPRGLRWRGHPSRQSRQQAGRRRSQHAGAHRRRPRVRRLVPGAARRLLGRHRLPLARRPTVTHALTATQGVFSYAAGSPETRGAVRTTSSMSSSRQDPLPPRPVRRRVRPPARRRPRPARRRPARRPPSDDHQSAGLDDDPTDEHLVDHGAAADEHDDHDASADNHDDHDDGRRRARPRRLRPVSCATSAVWSNLVACGWPGPSNTGYPAGQVFSRTVTGGYIVTADNTVIDGWRVCGGIQVRAQNVTIRNSWVTSTFGGAGGIGHDQHQPRRVRHHRAQPARRPERHPQPASGTRARR